MGEIGVGVGVEGGGVRLRWGCEVGSCVRITY